MPIQQSPRGKALSDATHQIIEQNLWVKILIGMVLGVSIGYILSPQGLAIIANDSAFIVGSWIKLPGVIFLSLVQMVIIPLVSCSIILGISDSGSIDNVKKLGAQIIPYFLLTTTIAISTGVALVTLIEPGYSIDKSLVQAAVNSWDSGTSISSRVFTDLTIPERIANLIPTNPEKAKLDRNMLQIVIGSIFVGIALLSLQGVGKPFRDLCISIQSISMKIIGWAMMIAPYAVFGLLCNITIQIGAQALAGVGLYMGCVLLGLAIMLGIYILIAKFIGKHSVSSFLSSVKEAQLIAFSTSSSAATIPVSIECAEENLKVSPTVSRFVIPLGATINMDGTAMYQAIAAVFLCQVFGIDLSLTEIILLVLTTVGASIGTPATPGVGIVVLATILVGLGVPAEGIALIIGVDRILDMCRTTVNVTGDLTAATIIQRWQKQS